MGVTNWYDAASFFSQTVYLMEEDDSIFCISAWNDFVSLESQCVHASKAIISLQHAKNLNHPMIHSLMSQISCFIINGIIVAQMQHYIDEMSSS